jgi:hypothetical protein
VATGVAIILLVMILAVLIPRPGAEVAISRVPWQATSPGGLSASRMSVDRDGGEEQGKEQATATGEKMSADGVPGDQQQTGEPTDVKAESNEAGQGKGSKAGGQGEQGGEGPSSDQKANDSGGEAKGDSKGQDAGKGESSDANKQGQQGESSKSANSDEPGEKTDQRGGQSPKDSASGESQKSKSQQANSTTNPSEMHRSTPTPPLAKLAPMVGGLGGLLKLLFYAALVIATIYFAWRYRHEIARAIADILRQLRELFGGKSAAAVAEEQAAQAAAPRRASFSEFRDPFAGGEHGKLPPEELVRYTFSAFEAWANDRGSPRSPDCTPQELIGMAVEPETPMYAEAKRLIRLYSQVAYASQRVPREAANELRTLWQIMRASRAGEA